MSKAQFKVVAGALRSNKYLKEIIQEKDLISNEQLSQVLDKGLTYFRSNNTFPTNTIVKDLFEDEIRDKEKLKKYKKLIDKIYTTEINDTDFFHFLKKTKEEKKERMVKVGLGNTIELLQEGDLKKAEGSLLKLADTLRRKSINNRVKRSLMIDDDYVDYYLETPQIMIPLSVGGLNSMLGGGTQRGDIVIWQAGTGRGKSIALMEQADVAWEAGYNVAHVAVELSQRKQQDRYFARKSGWLYNTVKKRQVPLEKLQEIRNEMKEKDNKFGLIDVPINSSSELIRLELEDYVTKYGDLDVIVVDPVYMIKALYDSDSAWEEKGNALLELKQIGADFGATLHTANQIKNKDLNKLEPDTDSGSQSFLYAAGADVVINIIMTDAMRKKGIAKLKFVKARDGEAGGSVFIQTAYGNMIFCKEELKDFEFVEEDGKDF